MDQIVPLGAKLAEAGAEQAKGFFRAVLHAPGVALGGLLSDPINERRHANLIRIAVRAQKRLEDAGVDPQQVPLSIIHPALQAASLEEDPDLQEMWANLLANAADPRADKTVSPVFPEILKQLSPKEARFLDKLFDVMATKERQIWVRVPFEYSDIHRIYRESGMAQPKPESEDYEERERRVKADEEFVNMCLDMYRRQELIIESIDMDVKEGKISGEAHGFTYNLPYDKYRLTFEYNFSRLGFAFMTACRPPRKLLGGTKIG